MNFWDLYNKKVIQDGNLAIWEDTVFGQYTLRQVDDASGRIYNYLHQAGIGKEDIVTIRMRRSARIFITMLGVWKAGAAYAIIGEYSPDHVAEFIMKDANPKLLFDDRTYEDAMTYPIKNDRAPADDHDLACITYSSGSCGIFKGCMHEYGAIQRALNLIAATDATLTRFNNQRLILAAGFYTFTGTLMLIYNIIFHNMSAYVVPYENIGDDDAIFRILNEQKITMFTAPPKQVKRLAQNCPSSLQLVVSSYELMSYNMELPITFINTYGFTESFSEMTIFIADKAYDILPIGKPLPGVEMKLINHQGDVCRPGEIGEIYILTEFFRGYHNLPELTASVLVDGWFQTGDMAIINEDGNYVILGRKIDVRHTSQGYIIPA